MPRQQWWAQYKPTEKTFSDWKKEAKRLYLEENLNKDQIQKRIGYPVDEQGTPIKTTNKGRGNFDTRTGQRELQASKRGTAGTTQTVGENVYGKGVVAAKGSNLQEHHKRVISIYAPFFEGLNDKETKELAQWFVDEGAPLGHVKDNLEALTEKEHDAIHRWMKDNLMQVDPKDFPSFKNYSLNERFPAALTFLEQIQPAAEEQIDKLKLLRKGAKGLALAGMAAPFAVGLPMSAAETAQRYQIAQETGDPIDEAQTVLSGFSFGGDLASLFPPAAPLGEGVSTFADATNVGLDIYKENPEKAKALAKEGLKNTLESVDPITQVQRTVTRLVDQFSAVQRRLIDRAQTYEEKDALITLFKNQ